MDNKGKEELSNMEEIFNFPKNPMTAAGIVAEVKKLQGDETWSDFTQRCIAANPPLKVKADAKVTEELAKKLKGDKGWFQFSLECIVARFPGNKVLDEILKGIQTKKVTVAQPPAHAPSAKKSKLVSSAIRAATKTTKTTVDETPPSMGLTEAETKELTEIAP